MSAKKYMNSSGAKDAITFERIRKSEDRRAMKLLQVKYKYLDYVDGWFRIYNSAPIYREKMLFSGNIEQHDRELFEELTKDFLKYNDFNLIIAPLGVGKHVDHLLVKSAAYAAYHKEKLFFYRDQPYTLHKENINLSFRLRDISLMIRGKLSQIEMSKFKMKVLNQYKSQLPLLFNINRNIDYKETIELSSIFN